MTTTAARKPALPHAAHIAIASKVTAAVADAPIAIVDSLPAKVKESLDYFREVTEVAERIATEQPDVLADYRQDILANLDSAGPETEAMVDALLGSHVMARILADVAAGTVEPVAVTGKSRTATKAAAKKATPARRTRKAAESTEGGQAAKSDKTDAPATPVEPIPDADPADPFAGPDAEPPTPVEPKGVGSLYPAGPADDDF